MYTYYIAASNQLNDYHHFLVQVIYALISFYAVGCSKIDDNFFGMINASIFSRAPGTEILILCNTSDRENSEIIYSTCQDDGTWKPDPSSGLCPEFQGT